MNALDLLLEYEFVRRALLAALVVGVLCAVLGVFVVLRGLSMLGDGLAHISFAGFALGLAVSVYPLGLAIAAAVAGALLIHVLRDRGWVKGDAAIGILFSTGLALGVLIVSGTRGFNVDVAAILFGEVLAVQPHDILLVAALGIMLAALLALLYKEFFYLTFSDEAARVSGLPVGALNVAFTTMTAATIVVAARLVGILLVSALLVVPASTSLQLARSFRGALLLSTLVGALSAVVGVLLAVQFGLATGATVALTSTGLFVASLAARSLRGRQRGAPP